VFDVDELLDTLVSALDEPTPPLAVKEALGRVVSRPTQVADAMAPRAGGLRMLHRADDLTVIDATWAPGMRLLPHDHRMWAVIAIYQGAEENEFYRRAPEGGLAESNGRRLETGDVVVLGESTIHAVSNQTGAVTGAIHVYGGDFVDQPRSQWGPGDLVERPYDLELVLREFHDANVAAGLAD